MGKTVTSVGIQTEQLECSFHFGKLCIRICKNWTHVSPATSCPVPTNKCGHMFPRRPVHTCCLSALQPRTGTDWKLPKCPSTEEWMKKVWCIHPVKHYGTRKNDLRLHRHANELYEPNVEEKETRHRSTECILAFISSPEVGKIPRML